MVTAFSDLEDGIRTQILDIGAEETDITLPETLDVTLELQPGESGAEAAAAVQEPETQTEPETQESVSDNNTQTEENTGTQENPDGTQNQTDGPETDSGTEGETEPGTPPATENTEQTETPGTEEPGTQQTEAPVTEAPVQQQAEPSGQEGQSAGAEAPAAETGAAETAAVLQAEPPAETEAPVTEEQKTPETADTEQTVTETGEDGGILTSLLDAVFPSMTVHAAESTNVQTVENFTLTGVTWKIDAEKSGTSEFSSDETAAGNTYTYVPVLPETVTINDVTYTLKSGESVTLPEIAVTIKEKETGNPVARVEKNGKTEEFDDITEAFASVGAGETATITLLDNAETDITISGNVTLTSTEAVVLAGTVTVPSGASLTLAGDALTIKKTSEDVVYGVYVNGGKLVVEKGTIEAVTTGSSSQSFGVAADYGTVEIHGGSITAEDTVNGRKGHGIHVANSTLSVTAGTISGSSIGLSIASDNVSLSGGTFTAEGDSKWSNAIWINTYFTSRKAGGMLKKGFVYYDAGGAYAAGVSSTADSLPAGTYTIGACKDHSYGAWSSADSKVHTRICEYCGTEETTENHQFGEDGKCTVEGCTAQASAGVTVNGQTEYYTDISAAFSAASTAGTKAEVKLLEDIDYGSQGYISILSGDITLDLNGHTLTGKNQNQVLFLEYCQMTIKDSSNGKTGTIRNMNGKGVFVRRGASLTVESGRIETNPASTGWVSGTAINVAWGGSLTLYDGELSGYVGVHLDEGSVTIHGGSISGSWYAFREINKHDNVTLYGGTYTGGINTQNKTFAQILGAGRAYYDTETGSFLTEGLNQTGELAVGKTVSIQAAPVQITDGPSDLNLSYGFESGTAKLQVTAKKGETGTGEISYQWYRVNAEEGGTDEALTDSEGGYSGSRTDTLVLPDSWVSGGSGNFYCVVSCGGYSVSSRTAHAEIEACPHSQITGGVCQGCGKAFEASVSDGTGGSEVYYEVFEDAWTAAQGKTAEVTLLADVKVSETLTVTSGSNITLKSETDSNYTISGNVFNASSGLINIASGGTLTLESGTVENGAGGNNAIAVNGGHFVLNGGTAAATADGHSGVCVYNGGTAEIQSGNVSGDIGVAAASDGSTITILDGNISGRASGVYVSGSGAKITITGGTISASNTKGQNGADGAALRIQKTGSALLSGGIYSGAYGILIDSGNSITLKELLDVSGDVKYAYYSNGVLVTEGLDGKTLTGSLTVGECGHSYKTWTDKKDGENHSGTCVVCGHEETKPHDWDTDGSCKAEGCTAQAAASVTVNDGKPEYYATIEKAWQAAKGNAGGATVTLLSDVTVASALTVDGNDNITLTSEVKNGGNDTYTISGNGSAVISISGGSLTLEAGTVAGREMYSSSGVTITGGSFYMEDGSVSGYMALDIQNGEVYISGGSVKGGTSEGGYGINAIGGRIELTGGTYYGESAAITNMDSGLQGVAVSNLLAEGYAFKQNDSWVSDTTVSELKGTVTVLKVPIQSVNISPATTTITYGDTAPTLTATVTQPDGSANDVTYQWYLDGEEIAGATGDTYTPDKLDAGEYTYTCTATVDGYSLPGTAATVTVNRADIENAVVTLTGTSFEYIGGTEIAVWSVVLNGTELELWTDYTYSGYTGKDAGIYTVKVEGKGNYTGIATATWEIYQKELTVGNWEIEKAYDGTNDISLDVADAVLYGVCDQDDVKLDASGVTAQFADASAGEGKDITYTGEFTLTGKDAGNYILKKMSASLTGTITRRKITVTPDSLTKECGAGDPKLTYQLTSGSLLAGHTLTLGRAEGESEGNYAINTFAIVDQDGNDVAGNYDVTLEAVDFQITRPDLATATVTLEQTSFIYDGTAKTPAVTVVKNGNTLTEDTDYTVTYENNVDVGTASVTITAVENGSYEGSQTVTFKIRPVEEIISVEVSWDALEYTYTDGAWNPDTYTYEEGEWTADNGGNSITVKNTGSVDTTVSYQYSPSVTTVSGRFSGDDGNFIDAPVALAQGEEKKAYLALAGRPSSDFTAGTLGTVTVTIGGEE